MPDYSNKKVLVIGSGPIVIGQAAEFDYSGSQACKALREEGVKVVLVNSNPATIQTDSDIADTIYIEPLNVEFLEKVIAKERPYGLIATMGGQTGLNLAVELAEKGILEKYDLKVLGTGIEAIKKGEDRDLFKKMLSGINEPFLPSESVHSVEDALSAAERIGFPAIIRPGFTLGGTGGGIAFDEKELREFAKFGLNLSMNNEILIEKCVIGWAEIEYEVMRDSFDNCITICNMENVDPMGIHTGESIVVAPSQTLSNNDYQMLRTASIKIIRALGVEGGCNVQFALNQDTGEYYVIEVNPRLSRSSALASKATGYPIARVAAKIALGKSLYEIKNMVTKTTPASFEPALDYVVTKIPRWPFDKMPEGDKKITTQMKSTGEVMAIGRTFEESLMKAMRSLEVRMKIPKDLNEALTKPTHERIFAIFESMRNGKSPKEISRITKINQWFLEKIAKIVMMEKKLKGEMLDEKILREAKKIGFSDKEIGKLVDMDEKEIRRMRKKADIVPVYKMVDTCAAEFEAQTPYYYSTYEQECEVEVSGKKKVIVIGSGPIRIGQGIEFDYCCCHASFALKEMGVEAIMINNNPETISTDFDTSDKLYFEPLTFEDVMNVIEKEKPFGIIVQFGGQTSINLAMALAEAGVKILGTDVEGIDIAEDRERFRGLLQKLKLPQPRNGTAKNEEEAFKVAKEVGYPVVVRPSYVIAGRAMQIINSQEDLEKYVTEAVEVSEKRPVLIDKYLDHAIEVEIDAVTDEKSIYIGGIMEHIEKAGVHSGDASCVVPPVQLEEEAQKRIIEYSKKIAFALKNIGAINIQYAFQDDILYVLEANPRGSRTMPFLSKTTGIPIVKVATRVLLGENLEKLGYADKIADCKHYAIKSVVFPFIKLPGVDIVLGPEMKSTGESMGIDSIFGAAFYKTLLGGGMRIPNSGGVGISVNKEHREEAQNIAREFHSLGFRIYATDGTAEALKHVLPEKEIRIVKKISEGMPNMLSLMDSREIQLIVNTPSKGKQSFTDGFKMRRYSLERKIPLITTIEGAKGIIEAIRSAKNEKIGVHDLGYFHKEVTLKGI